jgi:hypothetical protein
LSTVRHKKSSVGKKIEMNFSQKAVKKYQLERIIALRELDYTYAQIGIVLGLSEGAVRHRYNTDSDIKEMGEIPKVKKTLFSTRLGVVTKRLLLENPKMAIKTIRAQAMEECSLNSNKPSYESFRRFIKQTFELKACVPKPLISGRNKRKRLEFALQYMGKCQDFWDRVIWSDETMVECIPTKGKVTCWVRKGTKREDLPSIGRIQGGGFKVMFWGCFSKMGMGPLVAITGSMGAESYLKLLKDHFYPAYEDGIEDLVFMQDNAPCHKARQVMQFFEDKGIDTLPWPPQSPDMNPIENLWALMKRKLKDYKTLPANRDELIARFTDIWYNLPEQTVDSLADSAFKRLEAVRRAKGGPSKY